MDDEAPLDRGRLKQRLPMAAYRSYASTWHVTITALDRASRPFANHDLAIAILTTIDDRVATRGAILHVSCLMPDHVHLIVQLGEVGLVDLVRDLKSVTTRAWWKHGGNGRLWQESFYDRGVRESDDFDAIAAYILDNPVRSGLVGTWNEYPYIVGEWVERRLGKSDSAPRE